MAAEHIPGAILLTLICLLIALGLWYLGLRYNKLKLKQFAVMIGVMPVIGIGLQLGSDWFGWFQTTPEFNSGAVLGSPNRKGDVTDETRFPVTDVQVVHEIRLTPKVWGSNAPPSQPVRIRYIVRSPKGEVLAQGEQEFAPAQGLRWSSEITLFRPREEGQHTLVLEIPNQVGSVSIRVRELR
jgi:hypothetical protein